MDYNQCTLFNIFRTLLIILHVISVFGKINCGHVNCENPSDTTGTANRRNITLLERYQARIPNRARIYRIQEIQLTREDQIRKGVRNQGPSLCPSPSPRCLKSRYRTIDGTCNNFENPRLGSSGECTPRLLPAEYGDKISAPKRSITGRPLPNPRLISLALHSESKESSTLWTQIFMNFGQFIDHEITSTPPAQTESGDDIQCCPLRSNQGSHRGSVLKKMMNGRSKWCYPISLPNNDPFYTQVGQKCMEFARSAACLSCSWGPRYQLNEVSSYIDGSGVYGSLLNETLKLRNLDGSGTLKVNCDSQGKVLLPRSLEPDKDGCSQAFRGIFCFNAGDSRVNQHAPLAALHTLWHRHHNNLAGALRSVNPHWDGEKIFQEVRHIVAAQLQVIIYKEWLPIVLGNELMAEYDLNLLKSGFTEYDPTQTPSITSEFNTAAFRFGHSLIRGLMTRVASDGFSIPYRLRDNFFKPYILRDGNLDSIIRGLITAPASSFGPEVDEDVRNHLYQPQTKPFGGDLVAINIQRGRDHAIPGYPALMKYCYSKAITSWPQLDEYMPYVQRSRYQSLYSHIYDIDLFSAGLSEYPVPGAVVGPIFACIIGNQFRNLKFGDRFWLEHSDQDGSFTEAQLNNLRETSLAQIICSNGDAFTLIQRNVFLPVSEQSNPLTPCSSLPGIDLSLWTETPPSRYTKSSD